MLVYGLNLTRGLTDLRASFHSRVKIVKLVFAQVMCVLQRIDQDEVERLEKFVEMLNQEASNGAVVVVEGKRDLNALMSVGFAGNIAMLNSYRGVNRLTENLEQTGKIILMLDMDRKGKYLTRKIIALLQHRRKNVDLFYKKMLAEITKGRIRHIEELSMYSRYVLGFSKFDP